MTDFNLLPPVILNRIRSQLGLSDTFNIIGIDKSVSSLYNQNYTHNIAICQLPEDYYLVTVEDKKHGFKNGFVRLDHFNF